MPYPLYEPGETPYSLPAQPGATEGQVAKTHQAQQKLDAEVDARADFGVLPAHSASDNATRLADALAAIPPGGTVIVPPAPAGQSCEVEAIEHTNGRTIKGRGWTLDRNGLGTFGHAGYDDDTYLGGSILRFPSASGTAVSVFTPGAAVEGGGLQDIMLVGPGSGTSLGLSLGDVDIACLELMIRNVKVCNFARGVYTENLNEALIQLLSVRACASGVELGYATNNNEWDLLDVQMCGDGLAITHEAIYANRFGSFIAQANDGRGLLLAGRSNVMENPYFEANGTAVIVENARNCALKDPRFPGANGDPILWIKDTARYTIVSGLDGPTDPILDEGYGSHFSGVTGYVSTNDTTVLSDQDGLYAKTGGFVGGGFANPAGLFPLPYFTDGTRPSAVGVPAGKAIYNASWARIEITDGLGDWRDAAGSIV